MLKRLSDSCTDCAITDDIIDSESFSFSSDPPSHVTYRARLRGTSQADSQSLVSLIEGWVSGRPSVTVAGLRMRVASECSVSLSSLSEGECDLVTPETSVLTSSVSQPATNTNSCNTGAIIGWIVAIIFIIAITTIIVSVVALVIVKNYREISTKTVQDEG